ncbi:MAG: preprotein translocase subunit SecE [Candidatus Porifericomitaceae bacterium WSBS_2022_MAG_OTU9]
MGVPIRMDSWKLIGGISLVVVAVLAYYQFLPGQAFIVRFSVLMVGMGAGVALICWGREGRVLLSYLNEAKTELGKVVWPPRQQAGQMTMLVVAMVIVVAVILGLLDWMLSSLTGWFLS